MNRKLLSYLEIVSLCRGLALLLHAGIGVGDGLFLLAEEEEGPLRDLLVRMGSVMDDGAPLSQAMAKEGCFPAYVTGLVRLGEEAGRLEECLQALASYYENRQRTDRQVRSALLYPAVLILVMLVVIGVLLVQVLPVFDRVYASLGSGLTGLAGGLLQLGRMLGAAMPLLWILLAGAVTTLLLFAGNDQFRQRALALWNRNWGDRGVSRMLLEARFAQALAAGLRSGLTEENAVELAAGLLEDVPSAAQRCRHCGTRVANGESLSAVLPDAGMLPLSACRMLELGLRSGSGDRVMEEIARQLDQEASDALEDRVAQVEPTMVLISSILVGVILLSVMLPLMHIMSVMG